MSWQDGDPMNKLPVGAVLIPRERGSERGVWLALEVRRNRIRWVNLTTGSTYLDDDVDRVVSGDWDVLLPEGA